MSLLDNYIKSISDRMCISIEDLTETEIKIIEECFDIFKGRLIDIKTLEDENKRISIELANLRAMQDNKNYENE